MEGPTFREILARSWAVEVLVRKDDHEWWLSSAQRFATEREAYDFGLDMLLRPYIVRYRVLPSRLPPTIKGLFPT